MDIGQILIVVYVLVALVAVALTRAEARAKGDTNLFHALAGCLACALWPLTGLAAVVAISFARRSPAEA
jgi:hypothetical protein